MADNIVKKMIEEYKETERHLAKGVELLSENDYAKGKLDLIRTIISDLERLSGNIELK